MTGFGAFARRTARRVVTTIQIALRSCAKLRDDPTHARRYGLFASHRCARMDLKREALCAHIVTTGNCAGGGVEQVLRHAIMGMLGGGTSEIQQNVIAQRGLCPAEPGAVHE